MGIMDRKRIVIKEATIMRTYSIPGPEWSEVAKRGEENLRRILLNPIKCNHPKKIEIKVPQKVIYKVDKLWTFWYEMTKILF